MTARDALTTLIGAPRQFDRITEKDLAGAVVALAKKQITSAGLTASDIAALRDAIGPALFEATLGKLSAYQAKLLARRIDPAADPQSIATLNAALAHVRRTLTPIGKPPEPAAASAGSGGAYFGRKAFRTGG